MTTIHDVQTMHQWRKDHWSASVGLVPTMGYLHAGHLALVERASLENELTVVTIYVNPTQFGPAEDFDSYPRDLQRDLDLLAPYDVTIVFAPSSSEMYPAGFQTHVVVEEVTRLLEGASRPTHFRGVTTVVAKLFNLVQPTRAYFGQKDVQQTVVIRQMIRDLNFNLELVICPTVRETDGLAMSSRNSYLSAEQRSAAPCLYAALQTAEAKWRSGERDPGRLRETVVNRIQAEPLASIDYVSVAHPISLVEWTEPIPDEVGAIISLAVFFGKTRLIDNIYLSA